ncbi:MAG TPA: tetratricopeptide repeat protein [Candidatus Polarisedimenticolaceae bacterium]|nr:tetratricopeptide repeat protein [Candidatus Polarisedimenticolaceae bacterium]
MSARATLAALAIVLAASCGGSAPPRAQRPGVPAGARVGVDPVPSVHLFENHSTSLVVWRRAGARDRILVHVDGHSDLDWLPDATIARLAAAEPDELPRLELHPYALDDSTHARFAIWDFVYPAFRLGVVREYVWVVPDGTLADAAAASDLVRRMILGKMQMVSLEDAGRLHREGRTIRGTLYGLPVTVCELNDLPSFAEPVLLDIDLDFMTTASATSQEVTAEPWIAPDALVARLRERGVRADIATLSYSTVGGYLPPASRWVGPATAAELARTASSPDDRSRRRLAADTAFAQGRDAEAVAILSELAAGHPEDGSIAYALARAYARMGRSSDRADAWSAAVAADPILEHAVLFEADALWMSQRYAEALELYRSYRRDHPSGPYRAYGLRREAGCLLRTGRDAEAIAAFRKVTALAPRHGDTRLDLGVLLREQGDLDGAVAELSRAREILPSLGAYAMALGATLARRGDLARAIEQVQAAVALRPTWTQARTNLGVLLLEAGRTADAAEQLSAAATLEPDDPGIARLLARVRRQGAAAGGVPPVR